MNNKIFGVGLTRTGTSSLTEAMKLLGFKSVHYSVNPDYDVHYNDFICDMPIQSRFDFYDKRYPNSKFILTTRSLDSWLQSIQKWFDDHPTKSHAITGRYRIELYTTHVFNEQIFTDIYHRFHDYINNYFKSRSQDLLTINLCENPNWESICSFVDKPPPQVPFPHLNKNL